MSKPCRNVVFIGSPGGTDYSGQYDKLPFSWSYTTFPVPLVRYICHQNRKRGPWSLNSLFSRLPFEWSGPKTIVSLGPSTMVAHDPVVKGRLVTQNTSGEGSAPTKGNMLSPNWSESRVRSWLSCVRYLGDHASRNKVVWRSILAHPAMMCGWGTILSSGNARV